MTKPSTEDAAEPILSVRDLSSGYGSKDVLEKLSFSVNRGEIFVIMGSSGSGKTTLLRHLIGLQTPRSGSVRLLGQDIVNTTRTALFELRKRIGVAFQNGALINSMSVIDNIELPLLQHTKLDRQTIRIMSRIKLEMMALSEAEDLMPAELSGGMLKRAGLARAVIMDPQVLFFDEPSAGLDPVTSAELDDLILKLRDALNMTVIIVTHDLDSALKIADRIMVIAERTIAGIGTVEEIAASEDARINALLSRRANRTRLSGDAYVDHLTHD